VTEGHCHKESCARHGRATSAGSYARREPEKTVLYRVVQRHLEAFLAEHPGLPRYVEEEFRRYLDCGILGKGFILLKCNWCGKETPVAFSCKGKAFCPSCLTRRMHATAMDLAERVLPVAPYRHWVLAFPMQVRFHLARDEGLLTRLRAIFVRSVRGWLFARARATGIARPLFGAVAFTQRFSSRLMLYPHVHCVIPDGVFAEQEDGALVFHEIRPRDEDVSRIAARIVKRSRKILEALETDMIDPDELDRVRGQASQGELALKVVPVEAVEQTRGRLLSNVGGFSLQAQRRLHQNDRPGLEFLLRYVLRPPLALERMRELPNGKIEIGLKRPLSSGVATIELTPMALMRRLASIVAPPNSRDTTYYGILATHSKNRSKVVRPRRKDAEDCRTHPGLEERAGPVVQIREEDTFESAADESYIPWATLLKRVFGFDALRCECGGRMSVKQYVTHEEKIRENLERLGFREEPPRVAKARITGDGHDVDPPSLCDGVDPPASDEVA
jgi:hypothetical protein